MATPPVNWNNVADLTPGMKNLGNQINARFVKRYGDSDGAAGDAAHKTHPSGHNRDDTPGSKPSWEDADSKPDIRAIDVDSTLNDPDVSPQELVDHIRKLPSLASVLRFMIFNYKMYHKDNNFNPTPYSGSSPHTEHIHFEGAYTESADQNTTYDFRLYELGNPPMLPIKKGTESEDVKFIQYTLNDLGFSVGSPDGIYGNNTQDAVDAHRASHGQGPNESITAWQYYYLMRDLATKYGG